MKIIITLLSLLLTTSVYARTLSKRDDCDTQIENFKSCYGQETMLKITEKSLDTICSKKCKKILDDPEEAFSKCSKDKLTIDKSGLPNLKKYLEFYCPKDKDGNICPIVKLTFNSTVSISYEIFNQTIIETCKSKSCLEGLKNTFDTYFGYDPNNMVFKEYLNSEECLSQSGARSSSKISASLLLLTMSLLSAFLYKFFIEI